ncbi:UNVERIFIED_CONTAM: hypothetical protein FKN15_076255 [Acipenser sinensis]
MGKKRPLESTVDRGPGKTVTLRTALDIHWLLPAVQPAGPIDMKITSSPFTTSNVFPEFTTSIPFPDFTTSIHFPDFTTSNVFPDFTTSNAFLDFTTEQLYKPE